MFVESRLAVNRAAFSLVRRRLLIVASICAESARVLRCPAAERNDSIVCVRLPILLGDDLLQLQRQGGASTPRCG